ncbi:hypothetical protein [Pseudomonas syringae]|uniref:hypothetical protein n=1 Tax=Pseudomonas syringae TaxID=317 RepID=UPI001F268AE0|nr:hypothetical protein [Pseudomonas syringae]MBL3836839.1 hypothetical protein [Pseudomonas syringae pv. theae]MBL3866835.1 hypothetical protein [Pseudomonas syringae pv. theae]GKQ44406.1 hypothetical protein PSTH2693_04640 [Pseudomonas syringae pv. theae]
MSRKNRRYQYADTSYCSVGTMQCCACGKKITEGPYRYHETTDAYVPCHRICCEDDPKWLELDRQEQASIERRKLFEVDVLAFYDKWGWPDDEEFMVIVSCRPSQS